jgi:hypothetical protein
MVNDKDISLQRILKTFYNNIVDLSKLYYDSPNNIDILFDYPRDFYIFITL